MPNTRGTPRGTPKNWKRAASQRSSHISYEIMRLHEEFGLSVSDNTVYRALKDLAFSHVSARPRAYKQDAEATETFKKTSPSAWRKSAKTSHRVIR